MGIWNRRKKYSMDSEDESIKNKKGHIKVNKLIRRELYLTMVSIMGVTLVILGSTYAIFSSVNRSKEYNVINIGTLEITFDDTSNGLGDIIRLSNAYPVSDSIGLSSTPYKFTVKNIGTLSTDYVVKILDDQAMIEADGCADNLIEKSALKYNVNSNLESDSYLLSEKDNYVIATGTLRAGQSKTYSLKMWIDENAGNEVLGKHFHGKIVIETGTILPNSTPENCFTFDGAGTITGYKCYEGNPDGLSAIVNVVIPSSIKGVAVTTIGPSAFSSKNLATVMISEGITTIQESAFQNNQLTNVTFPSTITTIENAGFKMNSLISVDFPESLTMIGEQAFQYNFMTTIKLSNNIKTIGKQAFYYNSFEDVEIPASVTSIGDMAFYTTRIRSVTVLGKSSISDFESYPATSPFAWISGYSDENIIWKP